MLLVVDVAVESHPFTDGPVGLEHRNGAHFEPAVHAVVAPDAMLEDELLARRDGSKPRIDRGLGIVRVNGLGPAEALRLGLALPRIRAPRRPRAASFTLRGRRPHHLSDGLDERAIAVVCV